MDSCVYTIETLLIFLLATTHLEKQSLAVNLSRFFCYRRPELVASAAAGHKAQPGLGQSQNAVPSSLRHCRVVPHWARSSNHTVLTHATPSCGARAGSAWRTACPLPSSWSSYAISTSGDQSRQLGTAVEAKVLNLATPLGPHKRVWGQCLPACGGVLWPDSQSEGEHLRSACVELLPGTTKTARQRRRSQMWSPETQHPSRGPLLIYQWDNGLPFPHL